MNKNVASCVSVLQVAIPTPEALGIKSKDKEGDMKYRSASANFFEQAQDKNREQTNTGTKREHSNLNTKEAS